MLVIYPVIVLHDSLYDIPSLNYWVNEWFRQKLAELIAEPQNKNLDISPIQPVTLIDIDTLILYRAYFQRGELNLFKLLQGYQQHVNFNSVGGTDQ